MKVLGLIAALLCGHAWGAQVQGLRLWPSADNTRVVLDLSAPVKYRVFTMTAPDRVVVDLYDVSPPATLQQAGDGPRVKAIRAARRNRNDYRLVFDLARPFRVEDAVLAPGDGHGHRLVIDVFDSAAGATTGSARAPAAASAPAGSAREDDGGAPARAIVVAIDPGHGGEDPGATGRRGTREKDIVLAIARRLKQRVDAEPGMRAILTREGDQYVGLRERMQRARAHRADLFVSIHADAFREASVQGSSVYVLSQRGASSEAARWLAEQENAADLVGGVTLQDKDELLKSVLIDLSQAAAIGASVEVANKVLRELGKLGRIHRRSVQYAGFMVLKSPDIPSILVETAFISNPNEEVRLRAERHQSALADALLGGIRNYFRENPPPGTLMAAREHRITAGETLTGIASRYRVSTDRLRTANGLNDDRLRAGDVLHIP
ncbi:MAG: N-acetylmuramoyl-L-alanine amidase [Gammaproteobacteria bacterium]|nr:N-acetylmuramoyl-L-alanine amidase [Gammaproteobacteria bacterium]